MGRYGEILARYGEIYILSRQLRKYGMRLYHTPQKVGTLEQMPSLECLLAVAASAAAFQPAPTARAATVARPTFVAFAPRAAPRAMFDMFKSKEPEPPEEPEKAKPKISLDGLMQANSRSSDGLPARGPVHHTAVRHMWPRTSHVAHGLRHTTQPCVRRGGMPVAN